MTNANWAWGSTLTSPAGVIAELDEIGALAPRAETIDVTHLASTGGYREFVSGLRDGGEITLRGNFYPGDAPQMAMKTYFDDGVARAFTITLPAAMAATITFSGIVTGLEVGPFPVAGKVALAGTIKVTGKPAINVTASNNITVLTGTEETGPAVLDFVPNFLATVYDYSVKLTDSLSDWIKLEATFALGVGTITCLGASQNIISVGDGGPVESGPIWIGAANSLTDVVVSIKEPNLMPTVYTIHVARP